MPAVPVSETNAPTFGRSGVRRLVRFASVGVAATTIYAVCAIIFAEWDPELVPPEAASLFAYAVAATCSYLGHKFFTFMSGGSHAFEAPRFAVLTGFGLVLSYLLPAIVSGQLGMPVAIPVFLTCVLIPLINYVVLGRWVFSGRKP